MPAPPSACRLPASTASNSRPTATSWTASGRRPPIFATMNYGGTLDNRMRFSLGRVHRRGAQAAVGPDFIVGIRMVADEDWDIGGPVARRRVIEIAQAACAASGKFDFLNIIKRLISITDAASHQGHPHPRACARRHRISISRAMMQGGDEVPRLPRRAHGRRGDGAPRHALAEGKLDMVGMTRDRTSPTRISSAKVTDARRGASHPPLCRRHLLSRPHLRRRRARCASTTPRPGARAPIPHVIVEGVGSVAKRVVIVVGAGPAGLEAARVACRARPCASTVLEATQRRPAARSGSRCSNPRRKELIGIVDWRLAGAGAAGGARCALRHPGGCQKTFMALATRHLVIIATGGHRRRIRRTRGRRRPRHTSSWDIIVGRGIKPAESGSALRRQWRPYRA